MSEPKDMILPLLRDLRDQIAAVESKIDRYQVENLTRLDKVEAGQKSIRNAITHDTMLSKFVLGDFEERLSLVEQKLDRLTTKPA